MYPGQDEPGWVITRDAELLVLSPEPTVLALANLLDVGAALSADLTA